MTMCNNGLSVGELWELIDELAEYVGTDVADDVVLAMVRRIKAISDGQKGHLVVTLHDVSE
ncbi:hypothetical protein ELS78_21500 [Aeromonas veronii]|uniref:hypothetical protein n=1 Tax=Aeromonas veronii TaxID=654 RepID=UPI000F8F38A3|nr:hypothetical protein [Aeromonas veronii]RUR51976.1 hypothetical protein ELS78_21500 [Aeromonas veronii]